MIIMDYAINQTYILRTNNNRIDLIRTVPKTVGNYALVMQ